jgi:hypothetical protein
MAAKLKSFFNSLIKVLEENGEKRAREIIEQRKYRGYL